ncbi:MAG TPA: SPOR domain-containing protein, partial [Caulobacteraceae bacterium]|nr:SPOR domain-containing protein [Caulobacteraceae bacterium]
LTAEAAGLRAPIRIAVVDPLEMPNSRDMGLRAAFAVASAVAGREEPVRLQQASAATAAPVRAAASSAVYAAQLASFRTRADAEAAWATLKARHSGLLRGVTPRFEAVDLGAKGTWVRLKAGPLASRDEAVRICRAAGVSDAWCAKATLSS